MDIERITMYVESSIRQSRTLDIHFKGRLPITGLFIQSNDYNELKAKNFWRVVHLSNLQEWIKTGDANLARIFNGTSFTSLVETTT